MPRRLIWSALLLLIAASAVADWQPVTEGVEYQHFVQGPIDIHVARIDLTSDAIRIIASRESERGERTSDFAKHNKALIAVNADYFDKDMKPIGMTVGPCGPWLAPNETQRREGVVAVGGGKAQIYTPAVVTEPPDKAVETAVSGWPTLIKECRVLSSSELPGSDQFTRSPHPRTAAGLSADRKTFYLVVADGRRPEVPGLTLAQLGAWMSEHLDACSAINFDGGGSTAMWVEDKIVNQPSDGFERRVGNHLAVVRASDVVACDKIAEAAKVAANEAADAARRAARASSAAGKPAATITTTTTSVTTTTGGTTQTTTTSVQTTTPATGTAPVTTSAPPEATTTNPH